MAITTLAEGRTFLRAGKNITSLYRITEGSVSAFGNGEELLLSKGDIIGLCELASPIHLFSYKTLENTTLDSVAFSGWEDLLNIFRQDTAFAFTCLQNSFSQSLALHELYFSAVSEAESMYQSCLDDETVYLDFCRKHRVTPGKISAMDTLTPFNKNDSVEDSTLDYLTGFQRILNTASPFFIKEPEVLMGLLKQNALKARETVYSLKKISDYLSGLYRLYAASGQPDFISLYFSLLYTIGIHTEDSPAIEETIMRFLLQLENSAYSDLDVTHRKATEFKKWIAASRQKSSGSAKDEVNLTGSLNTILNFSSLDSAFKTDFYQKINTYRDLKDRSGSDEESTHLRKEITASFLQLYEDIVLRSLDAPELPPAVSMFLHFGFIDEELAGEEETNQLYNYSKQLSQTNRDGIYTLYRWLLAIYHGKKEPSRNTFDEDYTDCLHARKISGKITEEEEKSLLQDNKQKLLFELHNMFPNVNKMTYGRIATYCPVFSNHNIFKTLDTALVTPDAIYKVLNLTAKADFQAFYREILFTGENSTLAHEYIHTEILPDFILMPCAGTRGVMWQEIEGKKRSTPARMMLPVFQMEDLTTCLLHMIGEYRWEMCKRIQGARWNDVSESSLTSEYFDYLQFYRKNPDFTPDAKEKIKSSLQKCKNNFKEMFVRDYIIWVLYESTGSPRLNKAARGILFSHCPFSAPIRTELLNNPLFKEYVERYNIKNKQKLHRLNNLFAKIRNSGHPVPDELERESEFLNL